MSILRICIVGFWDKILRNPLLEWNLVFEIDSTSSDGTVNCLFLDNLLEADSWLNYGLLVNLV